MAKQYLHINIALIDQFLVSGVNFLTGFIFARALGIDEFGRFTLVWLVVLFVNSIQMAFIGTPMMSIGPKQIELEKDFYYSGVFFQQIFFTVASFLLVFYGISWSKLIFPELDIYYLALPLAVTVIAVQLQDFLRRYFFAQKKVLAALISDAISYLGQVLVLLIFNITIGLTIVSVLWTIALTSIISVGIGSFSLGKYSWNSNYFRSVFIRHWSFSKWITASTLLTWTSGNLFIVIAGNLLGVAAVGAIKASQNIMSVTNILLLGIENFVPVQASINYSKYGVRGLSAYLKKITLLGFFIVTFIALIAIAFPEYLLGLLYGSEYLGYGVLVRWYAIAYIIVFFASPLQIALRTLEKTQPIFIAYCIMTVFSVFFAKPLIQYFGIIGAMIGIVANYLILVVVQYLFLKHSMPSKVMNV